jgi:hypothetical protein
MPCPTLSKAAEDSMMVPRKSRLGHAFQTVWDGVIVLQRCAGGPVRTKACVGASLTSGSDVDRWCASDREGRMRGVSVAEGTGQGHRIHRGSGGLSRCGWDWRGGGANGGGGLRGGSVWVLP